MKLTDEQVRQAQAYRNRGMNYTMIGVRLGVVADDVRDAVIPGWREKPVARGRHRKR